MTKQNLTVRQKQRIGAKMARYNREVDERLENMRGSLRGLLLDMIERCYRDGFGDGIDTALDEIKREKMKPKY